MKRSELLLSAILLPLDLAALLVAGISAYYLRFTDIFTSLAPVIFRLPFLAYFRILLVISGVWLVLFVFSGLYNLNQERKLRNEIKKVIMACSLGLVAVVIYIFFFRELFSSRFIVLAAYILAMIYMSLARIIVLAIKRGLYSHGLGLKRIVLIGSGKTAEILLHEFSTNKKLGYKVVKRFDNFGLEEANELETILGFKEINEVIQSDLNLSKAEILRLYDFADEHHLTFKYAADLLDTKVLRVEVSELAGVPIAEVKKTPLDGWGRILKRLFDIIVSLLLIIITSPILIITAILIKLDSRGPVFYKNERVSKDGFFKLFKFRSMASQYCVGDEYDNNQQALAYEKELIAKQNTKEGPVYKIGNDPRITRVGRFIRRWSIDELPQFFNVFMGNMSLVGPRPHQPREVEKYQLHHKKVLTIKPGITGMAQVSGRSDLSFEDEVKLDTYYIENWSIWLDLVILLKTPMAVLRSRTAA